MSLAYIDDESEDDEETVESIDDFENEGIDIVLDFDSEDITISDGDTETTGGKEGLEQWIKKVFLTRRDIFDIYSIKEDDESDEDDDAYDDDLDIGYGSACKEILLNPDLDNGLKLAMIQEDIENTLNQHPDIDDISGFSFTQNGGDVVVTFTISSIYGEIESEVSINGTNSE